MNISIFGLGYVGAVTSGCLAEKGHVIIGVDALEKKVNALNRGVSPILEPGLNDILAKARKTGALSGTLCAEQAVKQSDVSIVCVGTPSQENGSLNLNYVRQVTEEIANAMEFSNKKHTIIFRSTMLPGSTREMVERFLLPLIDRGKLEVFYCPEFLREGSAIEDFRNPSLTVIGVADGAVCDRSDIVNLLSEQADILTWEEAELVKYSCNYFHALKVAFTNEIGRIGKQIGVDTPRIMEVFCKDTKLNISDYYMRPGNPFGGFCLPKDVRALAFETKQIGVSTPLLDNVMLSNKAHFDALFKTIQSFQKKNVAILGLTFKEGTDDLRESPMVVMVEYLLSKGYKLRIYDKSLNGAESIGSNEGMTSNAVPSWSGFLCDSLEDTIVDAELVIVSQKCGIVDEIRPFVNKEQHVIDVNGWKELESLEWQYEGSCW